MTDGIRPEGERPVPFSVAFQACSRMCWDGDFAELGCVRACQGEARHSREEPQETFSFSFSGVVSIGTSVHQETIF